MPCLFEDDLVLLLGTLRVAMNRYYMHYLTLTPDGDGVAHS